jgi:protease-4
MGKGCARIAGALLMSLGLFFVVLLVGVFALMKGCAPSDNLADLRNRPTEKLLSGTELSPEKIVILPIEGPITEDEFGFVRNAIQTAYEDLRLSGLILRVNSPGGTIAGSDYYYKLLRDLKKERNVPVYVSMGGMAASGGYYVSMVGDKIFAERSCVTGAIGVIAMLIDASSLCERIGVRSNYIVSGKNKGMGDITRPMSEEERAIWQGLIDESYEQFLAVIREGRPAFTTNRPKEDGEETARSEEKTEEGDTAESGEPPADDPLRALADGRVYSASEAKALGLIDEIGFLQDAVEAMIKDELKVPEKDVQVVRYKKPESILTMLGAGSEGKTAAEHAVSVIETISVPTLYYIVPGTLPTL